jgi:hypothetical protein
VSFISLLIGVAVIRFASCFLFIALLSAGCQAQKEAAQEASTIKPLALLYGQFLGKHKGQPPKDEAEFKAFVQAQGKPMLDSFAIADADSLFVSPRDKQPYGVIYGKASGPPGPGGAPVIIYEKSGSGGKRYVASNLGAVEEVDSTKFQELVPGAP